MKIVASHNRLSAFTIWELLVVVVIVAIFAGLLDIGVTRKSRTKSQRVICAVNLKQVGTACRTYDNPEGSFAGESAPHRKNANDSTLPWQAFEYFQSFSNALTSTKMLVCPADTRIAATGFSVLSNSTVSYFAGLDAVANKAEMFLAGDRNLRAQVPLVAGVYHITTNEMLYWTPEIHEDGGNIVLADGSVQKVTADRATQLLKMFKGSQRLSMP